MIISIQLCFYISFFSIRFDDCYLCANLFVEHHVLISRFSYLVLLISLIASLIAQTSRRRYSLVHECFSRVSRGCNARATVVGRWMARERLDRIVKMGRKTGAETPDAGRRLS